jgi:hypothetical protein
MAKTRKRKGYSYSYYPNVYGLTQFRAIRKACDLIPKEAMKLDSEPTTKNRLTYQFKKTDPLVNRIYTKELIQTVRTLTGNERLEPYVQVPVEYRVYGPGATMNWHTDRQILPTQRQYECVITLRNTSDSETLVKQGTRNRHFKTEPNSIFVVQAKGISHCVTPVTKGFRSILKVVFYEPTVKNLIKNFILGGTVKNLITPPPKEGAN